ncbi:glycosyltransferase family 2 protein [Nocardioides sp.]|uniref:glycosyltransferase family 2 protein n=1 Tax=Nocardioides sp. TaxID=35761 RepID=UPI002F417E3B
MDPRPLCDLVLPCRDEARALPALLAEVPAGFRVIVVDNGSRDGTSDVARQYGARVLVEPRTGYGAAVQCGVEAAESEYVAVMDGDGSFDPAELGRLLRAVREGDADLALGRRRPVARGVWPWHARVGNALVVAWLRRTTGFPARDIAPMRVCRRTDLLALDVRDRRFGYPLELLRRATGAGWRIAEYDVAYRPRAAGTRSKVSGSLRGTIRTARDFWKVRAA